MTALDRLADRFQNSMLSVRAAAARDLLDPQKKSTSRPAADLLDFFTNIGFLVESKVLDLAWAYTFFDYYVLNYWHCCPDLIAAERSKDSDSWKTLERFADALRKYPGRAGDFRNDPDFLSLEASRI